MEGAWMWLGTHRVVSCEWYKKLSVYVNKWAACVQNTNLFNVKRCWRVKLLPNIKGLSNFVITCYMHVWVLFLFGESSRDLGGVVKVPSFG